jgi:general secretion pathway protein B
MSFILDALRKSENERQRKQQPGVAGMQVHKPRRGSGFWIPLVALLVGVNLSLVFVMWIMGEREQPAVTSTSPATDLTSAQPQPRVSVTPATPATVTTTPTPTEPVPSTTAPVRADIYSANASEEFGDLPTIEELVMQNAITVDPLRLDIHVYSQQPTERFVFINMTKYTEGDTLEEGPKLVAINASGIVLLHQGQEFLMSRE